MGNASASKHDAAMGWADANPASARTVALQAAWRAFMSVDRPHGNAHDHLYAAIAFGYDTKAAEVEVK